MNTNLDRDAQTLDATDSFHDAFLSLSALSLCFGVDLNMWTVLL